MQLVLDEQTTATPLKRTPQELAEIASQYAASETWIDRVRLRTDERWYERLFLGLEFDVWVISWMPGQSTGFHDHGESAGAFVVNTGELEEHRPGLQPLIISSGRPRAFGSDYAHDVRNNSLGPAVSIHVYSPPLTEMNEYHLDGERLVPRQQSSIRAASLDRNWQSAVRGRLEQPVTSLVDQLLARARARLSRLSPQEAYEAQTQSNALLVDVRPERQRAAEGSIPGAIVIERNVLEWRLDPTSDARLPQTTDHDLQVIVFCSEGYTSSLAAASLQELGLWHATDIVGGFKAWQDEKLPSVILA